MRRAILADRDAGVRRTDLHVEVRIADRVPDLVVAASGAEDGKGAGEDRAAGKCEACRHIDHVLLGDAHIDKAVRIVGTELGRLRRACQVGVDRHHIEAFLHKLDERLSECLAGRSSSHLRPPSEARRVQPRAQPGPGPPARRSAHCHASLPGSPCRRRPCP